MDALRKKGKKVMSRTNILFMAVAVAGLLATAPVVRAAQAAAAQAEEQKLIEVLKSDAPLFDKAKACQRLAVVGTKEAVPVLAALLADERLAHYARFGLEPIPDPSVDEALRKALGTLKGKLLVGVINSIGARRDSKALGALATFASDADRSVATAAADALARIGIPEAVTNLTSGLAAAAAADLRTIIAAACLPCAETLLAQGKRDAAIELYDAVRDADVPPHIQRAALRGAIIAREAAGVGLLVDSLKASERPTFAMALMIARELPGREVTQELVQRLGEVPRDHLAAVISALGDRGDATALRAVLDAAASDSREVRVAAVRALAKLGDASAVPVLMEAAQSEGDLAEAARDALTRLQGAEVDEKIAAMLGRVEKKYLPACIELVGKRRISSAVAALCAAADDPDENVRRAAVTALGETAGLDKLPFLTARVVNPKTPPESAAAQQALRTACGRMPDRDACAEKLLESMGGASPEGRCRLLEVFSSVGGAKALATAAAGAEDADREYRETALRVLGEWKSEDAAAELLRLAATLKDTGDKARALQALGAVISRLGSPNETKFAWCKEAMSRARSDEERRPLLAALAGIPSAEALSLATSFLDDEALKEEACAAAVAIAERLVRAQPEMAAKAMEQVLQATKNANLAERARKLVRQGSKKE
jgi:HEAT repeat protein